MNPKVLIAAVIFMTNFHSFQAKRYDNFSLFRVVPTDVEHLKFLQNLESQKYMDIIFWKEPYKLYSDVQFLVPPKDLALLKEREAHFGIHLELLLENVQEAFDAQSIIRYLRYRTETYSWEKYHTLEDIYQWLEDIVLKYPKLIKLETIGKSVENRSIYAVSFLTSSPSAKGKVVVEAGMHGHEWISTEFVTYLINALLYSNHTDDPRLKEVASSYQWYLVPVANPDGYEYSHKTDRLWRKNRKFHEATKSFGVNLNRNFEYSFCKHGSSNNPADDKYCGSSPFSEPETFAFANFVSRIANNLTFFFSFHAYGLKLIIPYADRILHVGNYAEMENYGKQAILKMYNMHGVKYSVGTTYDTLGTRISGNSASWVKKVHDVKYVFTFLLRDNGAYGYGLPPEQILPTCAEALTGLLEIMTASPRRVRANVFSNSSEVGSGHVALNLVVFLVFLLKVIISYLRFPFRVSGSKVDHIYYKANG